jgi:hypothetical protein
MFKNSFLKSDDKDTHKNRNRQEKIIFFTLNAKLIFPIAEKCLPLAVLKIKDKHYELFAFNSL